MKVKKGLIYNISYLKKLKQRNSAFKILTRSRQLCHLWPSLGSNSTTPLSNQKLINHCKRRNVHLLLVFVAIYFFFVFIIMKLYQAICLFYITTMIKKTINLEKINFEKMLQVLICIQGKALNAIVDANSQ